MELRPIARVRSDFGSKFGVPRQSGLVPELTAVLEFEPEFRSPEAVRDWRNTAISGSSGSSPRMRTGAGVQRSVRRAWAETGG